MIRLPRLLIVVAALLIAHGCDKPPEIRQYRVAKSRSDLGEIGIKSAKTQSSALQSSVAESTSRMVVAIAARDAATWFFKISGSEHAVTATEVGWTKILATMNFDSSGNPQWQLPAEWTLGPERQMRYATLRTESENGEPVEMSISNLGPGQNLLENVNRWRGQLSIAPIGESDLNLKELESTAGKLLIFDETGSGTASGPMAMSTPPPQARGPVEKKLVYNVPDGWVEGSQNSIVRIRLLHGEDKKSPQITVTQMLAAANEWVPNAQRWAGQIGMETDPVVLEKLTTSVSVDEVAGRKIRLVPGDASQPIGIIAVMVVRDELAWFFKMVGDTTFIADNENDFDEFLKSFRFD